MSRLTWPFLIFLRYYRNLGLRVTLYALLSILAALAGPVFERLFGDEVIRGGWHIGFDSVLPVLTILATSMLAVSTFSLNVMVSAHRAAATSTTPRVHRLLLADTTTQSVLATFVGAFVYSLSAIVLYRAGVYAESSAVFVMGVTVLVVVLVVIAILRWIEHLTGLGSVDESIDTVVGEAKDALTVLTDTPALGGTPLTDDIVLPLQVTPLTSPASGYLQLIDVAGLRACLPARAHIYLRVRPGAHVLKGEVLAEVSGSPEPATLNDLGEQFTFGDHRTFEQDPVFGLEVLSEIASRALSPGINDPGTAIDVINRLTSLLWEYARAETAPEVTAAPSVYVPVPAADELLRVAYAPIGRDGAGVVEVATRLRRSLAALATCGDPDIERAAASLAGDALDHAFRAGLTDGDRARLKAIEIGSSGSRTQGRER